jgi:hypothetical protein
VIWNRNRIFVTLAVIVWGISAEFHAKNKPLSLTVLTPPTEDVESLIPYKNV